MEHDYSTVTFADVGQVRNSVERLGQENFREEETWLVGELHGVLPAGRVFEFKIAESGETVRGKIAATVPDLAGLHGELFRSVRLKVMVTRVGGGRPRYVMLARPQPL